MRPRYVTVKGYEHLCCVYCGAAMRCVHMSHALDLMDWECSCGAGCTVRGYDDADWSVPVTGYTTFA